VVLLERSHSLSFTSSSADKALATLFFRAVNRTVLKVPLLGRVLFSTVFFRALTLSSLAGPFNFSVGCIFRLASDWL